MGKGFFDKVKGTVKAIGKNPLDARAYADLGLQTMTMGQVDTRGVNGSMGEGLKDTLLGKKAKDINPDSIADQIRNTQTKGLGELNAALDNKSSAQIIGAGAEKAKLGVLTSAQDARRNAQQSMARMGLKGSSLGLASQRSIDQQAGEGVASIDAALPGQLRNQEIQDAQTRIAAGNVNQNGMNFNTIEGSRSGGVLGIAAALAPAAGAVAGGIYGGPAGAKAGLAAGQGIGGALGQQQQAPQGAYNPNRYSMGNYQF